VLDPTNPTFEFLRPRKWRIQIMKMAGVFSEGLALPLSVFNIDPSLLVEGQDVTEELKVKPVEMVMRGHKYLKVLIL
jgi:hypothetical protein